MPHKFWQDNKGNASSMRIFLGAFLVVMFLMLLAWTWVFVKEASFENSNYGGLAAILSAIFGSGIGGLAAKAYQKRYEGDNCQKDIPKSKQDAK